MSRLKSLSNSFLISICRPVAEMYTGNQLIDILSAFALDFKLEADLPYPESTITKREMLKANLGIFNADQQYTVLKNLIDNSGLFEQENIRKIWATLPSDILEVSVNQEMKEARSNFEELLKNYPEIISLWKHVFRLRESNDYRDALDNARLALELLLKELLSNDKSLENQQGVLGAKLKEMKVPAEFRNVIIGALRSYIDIQNNHIKHALPEGLNDLEVNFILNETVLITKYLVKKFST